MDVVKMPVPSKEISDQFQKLINMKDDLKLRCAMLEEDRDRWKSRFEDVRRAWENFKEAIEG